MRDVAWPVVSAGGGLLFLKQKFVPGEGVTQKVSLEFVVTWDSNIVFPWMAV